MRKVAVIGGGAAGMMAAITAAENNAEVSIYEKNDRVGKKILVTGNGKCNFSNQYLEEHCFNGSAKTLAMDLFREFSQRDAVDFFEGLGMLVKEKNGGFYPVSEQASTVLDVLRLRMEEDNISVFTQEDIRSLKKEASGWGLQTKCGKVRYDSVIIACGGKAAPKTGSDGSGYVLAKQLGHFVVKPVPALVQLRCKNSYFKAVAGVRCDALLRLKAGDKVVQAERGELQLTDYGISGIPVFQLSGHAARILQEEPGSKVSVYIDFFPDKEDSEYKRYCEKRISEMKDRTLEHCLTGMANKKINLMLLKEASLKPTQQVKTVDDKKLLALFASYRSLRTDVAAVNSFDQAQVCAGGVAGWELSSRLESLPAPGIFFAGEVIDVDGRCGGYNLQWAWTSGYIAGRQAALRT